MKCLDRRPITETEAQARARLAGHGVVVLHPHETLVHAEPGLTLPKSVADALPDARAASLAFARRYYPHPEDALFHEGTHVRPVNWAWALLAAGLFIFVVCFALELSV